MPKTLDAVAVVERLTLQVADGMLKTARIESPGDPWRGQWPLVAFTIACAGGALGLGMFGGDRGPQVIPFLIGMLVAPQVWGICYVVLQVIELRNASADFFRRVDRGTLKQDVIVEGLALNGLSWVQEQYERLLYAMESQSQRSLLLLGKLTQGGVVPLIGSVYLAYRLHHLPNDVGHLTFEPYAIAGVLGLYVGFLLVFFHQERVRALVLVLKIAEQRLKARTKDERAQGGDSENP